MTFRRLLPLMLFSIFLSGCAVAAAPCRVAGAVVKIVPLVGDPVGGALDTCGDIID